MYLGLAIISVTSTCTYCITIICSLGTPAVGLFIAPSVTPWRYVTSTRIGPAHNPGIRLVKYDRTTGRHLGIEQYYLDLEASNEANETAVWTLEYDSSSTYGLADLTAPSLKNLADRMNDPESGEFKKFWQYYTVSPPEHLKETCGANCHASVICGLTNFYMDLFDNCKTERLTDTKGSNEGISFQASAIVCLTCLLAIVI